MRDEILDALLGPPRQSEVPFYSLMPKRVQNLLLVTSLYDCYTFIEDGRLAEMLLLDYREFNLSVTPSIRRVSTAEEALRRIRTESFDLVISMPRVGEMNLRAFCLAIRECAPNLPVVFLASNTRELGALWHLEGIPGIHKPFVWLGDVRLFLAIVKSVEDRANAAHDARIAGVKSILLVEDNVQFYSSYLPMLYAEVLKQAEAQVSESPTHELGSVRKRARPKILLASDYEEATELFEAYHDDLLGVILDASFPREGKLDRGAGRAFATLARAARPDLPIVMQSGSDNALTAGDLDVEFIDKRSVSLLHDLRVFMQNHLGFGDFLFRLRDGTIVSKANDLRTLDWAIQAVPDESLLLHAEGGHFVTWLRARVELELVEAIRAIPVTGRTAEAVRHDLLAALARHRERTGAGVVAEFSPAHFGTSSRFVRIGSGSLGGKGRGLAFVNALINTYSIERRIPDVRIFVPPTAVLATGVFDTFMETSGLLPFALHETDDDAITRAFLAAELPKDMVDGLWTFLDWVRYPLAVRSSSLLEDASYQPFAGIYETYMIPNNSPDPETRLEQLCNAIKMVYASTYHSDAKAYIESTPNRLEEEKMAVVIQQVMGRPHEHYHYPDFAGVGRSMNFYPMPGMKPEDGVVSVALGLGKTVVDGGRCVRFSPAHPKKPMQSFSAEDYLENAQREFLALDMERTSPSSSAIPNLQLVSLDLEAARRHRTLAPVASVYSPDNEAIHDGLSRPGIPLVTMAGVLKGCVFPLPEVLAFLLKVGSAASSCPVEIEFAVNLSETPERPHEFGFLQMRPLVLGNDAQDIPVEGIAPAEALCISHKTLGNGFLEGIRDVVYVDPARFDRSATPAIATEVGRLNALLKEARRSFLLVGPGRWGSADPWLGIPVRWAQISAVRCMIETDLEDIHVDPSQGSHFFQNLMSFGIGYLTVDRQNPADVLDYAWLRAQPAEQETPHLRHVRFEDPVEALLNGRQNFGAVLKPGRSVRGS